MVLVYFVLRPGRVLGAPNFNMHPCVCLFHKETPPGQENGGGGSRPAQRERRPIVTVWWLIPFRNTGSIQHHFSKLEKHGKGLHAWAGLLYSLSLSRRESFVVWKT